ncbi:hemolysin XhlA family protein [Viridibacillus arvi]|uniref:hemolysin XhlA family protein n=1 Tax=Viridibacillus arvi TaxID=263475 RepID=UPI00368DDA92
MGEELVRNIYERLGGIEAKLDGINQIRNLANRADEKADKADDKAEEALQSTKSAHKRLDKIDKIVWWVGTTIIGAVILALLALVIKTQ